MTQIAPPVVSPECLDEEVHAGEVQALAVPVTDRESEQRRRHVPTLPRCAEESTLTRG
jgi:hypothetical protein